MRKCNGSILLQELFLGESVQLCASLKSFLLLWFTALKEADLLRSVLSRPPGQFLSTGEIGEVGDKDGVGFLRLLDLLALSS